MESANGFAPGFDRQRREIARAELVARVARIVSTDGTVENLDGVRLRRASAPTELGHGTSFPSLCVVAQGAKETRLGERRFGYDPDRCLVVSTTLPFASRVTEASAECPYLGVVVVLEPALVGSVMGEAAPVTPRGRAAVAAMDVGPLDTELLEAVLRLVRLAEVPADARVLVPLIKREMVYRLLAGGQGDRVRQIATMGDGNRIAEAIARLRRDFNRPVRMEDLARELGMSVSGFHHHFKGATAMSPLQFQKQLRLHEARRLLLSEGLDAANAGLRVGYDDVAYFTRDYKRLFGAPPMRDVQRLRGTTPEPAVANL
jgi:AraC-like DNA-binding protein